MSFCLFVFRVFEFFEGLLEFFVVVVVVVVVVEGLLEFCGDSLELFEGPHDDFFFELLFLRVLLSSVWVFLIFFFIFLFF